MPAVMTQKTFSNSASTRGAYTLVGATLFAVSMLPAGVEKYGQLGTQRATLVFGAKKSTFTPDTVRLTKTESIRDEAKLFNAFHSVFESLLRSQSDLDLDTRRLLNAKMWDLYD